MVRWSGALGCTVCFKWRSCLQIFAGVVHWLMDRGAPRWLLLTIFACYALVSVHAIYSITMWKDILFGGFTALAVMMLTRLVNSMDPSGKEAFGRGDWFALTILLFLFSIYRNNGYYAFLLCFPVFLLCNRRLWKPLLAMGAAVLVLVNGYQLFIFDVLGAEKSAAGEALALPLQQIAKTVRDHNRELTAEETETLEEIFPSVEEVRWAYEPAASDPVKAILRNDVLMSDPCAISRHGQRWGEAPLVYLDVLL